MRDLTDEELELINSSLESSGRHLRAEKSDEGAEIKAVKPEVCKKARARFFFLRPAFWGGVFIFIPVIFTLAFMSVISRVDAVMGTGALEELAKLSDSDLGALGLNENGLDWIPVVVQIYDQRFLILSITWGVCLVFAALLFFFHFRGIYKQRSVVTKTARVDLIDEMEELNAAYRPTLEQEDNDEKDDT